MNTWIDKVKFDDKGLVTAVAIDSAKGDVLMLAHMNADALRITLESGRMTYWSRSRQALWRKGETSGNVLRVEELRVDCDQDAIWVRATAAGPACHTGARSCFYRRIEEGRLERID